MKSSKLAVLTLVLTLLLITSSAILANSPLQFFKHEEGVAKDGYKVVIVADGLKILETTAGDYYNNKEYYQRKYGFGDYSREDHSPLEPENVRYKPHTTALEKGYPKIFLEPFEIKRIDGTNK